MLTRHTARYAPVLLLLLTMLIPGTTADAAGLVGKGEVRKSGKEAAKEIEKKEGLYQSAATQRRVREIGNELAREAKYAEGTVFAFQVLDMEEVNAFALPSGHVYVTSGLIEMVGKNDDMLAAVIAHEIGHLSELHSFRRVEKVLTQSAAFTLLDFLFKDKIGKEEQMIAGVLDAYLTAEYSQDQEIEADKYGIVLASLAGYDPTAMASFLRKLAKEEKRGELDHYFASHPASEKRATIADEFLAEFQAGSVDLTPFTQPAPPPSAFTYKYPTIRRKRASESDSSGATSEPSRRGSD